LHDEVLRAMERPILFIQGTRDAPCPLEELERVGKEMRAPSAILRVESGDPSLRATRSWLKEERASQAEVDERILAAIRVFLACG